MCVDLGEKHVNKNGAGTFNREMKRKQMYGAQVLALRRVLSQYLNKNAMRRVTNSACRSWKKARATTAGVSMFFYCVNYGSMGCQASKRGITRLDRILVKSQYAKILHIQYSLTIADGKTFVLVFCVL